MQLVKFKFWNEEGLKSNPGWGFITEYKVGGLMDLAFINRIVQ